MIQCSDNYDPFETDFYNSNPETEVALNQTELERRNKIIFDSKFIRDVELQLPRNNINFLNFFTLINPFMDIHDKTWSQFYRFEFSHEFGYLKLSDRARKKVIESILLRDFFILFVQRRVEVITVVLDPTQDKCFGSSIGRALLIEWFGYETIILGKIYKL